MRSSTKLVFAIVALGCVASVASAEDAQEQPYKMADSSTMTSATEEEPVYHGPYQKSAKKRHREKMRMKRRGKQGEMDAKRMLATNTGPDSCSSEFAEPAYDTDKYKECVNNKKFYPIHWGGPSTDEEVGCMHILQSNQDENDFEDDVEDWILMGGSTNTDYITNTAGQKRIFIHMLDYIGGIKWAYYQNEDTTAGNMPDTIADCALANFGLQLAFITENPMHLLIFETLTGNILYQYRLGSYSNSMSCSWTNAFWSSSNHLAWSPLRRSGICRWPRSRRSMKNAASAFTSPLLALSRRVVKFFTSAPRVG